MSGFLAVDWGTTRLRAWRIEDGRATGRIAMERGVGALTPGEAPRVFRDEIAPALDAAGWPAILCGMAGSELGWRAVPHVAAPANATALAAALVEVAPGVRIVPGVKTADGTDVMRGEETQIAGWLAARPERAHGAFDLILPGTHAKHVRVEAGAIASFRTHMTGEVFALLKAHSTLRRPAAAWSGAAFDLGVSQARALGAAALFQTRARVVTGALAAEAAESFLSGVLIGLELKDVEPPDALIGDPALTGLYARALGRDVAQHAGDDMALAGFIRLQELSR